MKVSELSRLAGTAPSAVRWYEAVGVLPPAGRQANGYREYGEGDLARLRLGGAPRRRGAPPPEPAAPDPRPVRVPPQPRAQPDRRGPAPALRWCRLRGPFRRYRGDPGQSVRHSCPRGAGDRL